MTPEELRMATRTQAEIDSDVRKKQEFTRRYGQYLGALGAGADKTVWNDATKQYIQVPTVSAKEYAPIDAMRQGAKLRADAQAYYSPYPNINRPSYDPRFIDYVVKGESYGQQSTSQQQGSSTRSASQQQGSSTQSSQGGGGGGVSGIDFVWSGGNAGTRVGTPSGRQGTMDPLYDPKYRFWDKGIPSKFYDPVDPSKPMSFPEQTRREREARARWIGAMTDQEYSFYRRSLGQGAGSSGQDADAMRQAAKNPPAPKEEYGDPSRNQPITGPRLDVKLQPATASTATTSTVGGNSTPSSTNYMGGSKTFNESTGTRMENIKLGSGTGLGKPSLVKLPATPAQTSVVDRKMRTKKARPSFRFFS